MGRCATAATLLTALALFSGAGCDTDPTGVEDCRDIERARCRAAQHCDLGIDTDDEVSDCEHFARDHCLHGLAVEDEPTAKDLRRCTTAIDAAGTCAAAAGPDTTAAACTDVSLNRTDVTVCELVIDPEDLPGCAFLSPGAEQQPPSTTEPDAGTTPPQPMDAGDGG